MPLFVICSIGDGPDGARRADRDFEPHRGPPVTVRIASASIPPSCAVSNISPAPVYEVELTLETRTKKAGPVRFGSVGGGGVTMAWSRAFAASRCRPPDFPSACRGWQAALTMLASSYQSGFRPRRRHRVHRDRVADYQKMVATLRAENIRAELYLGNPRTWANQLKYADKRNSPCVIIRGSDEKDDPAGPQVLLKDLILVPSLRSWRKIATKYLQSRVRPRPSAQAALVDEVRKILDKHGVKWG